MEEHQRQDDIMIKVLEERVNLWMESTTEYRKALCAKLDIVLRELQDIKEAKIMALVKEIEDVKHTIAKLPCDARRPMWENVQKNILALWGFVGTIVLVIVSEWIKRK